VAIELVLQQTEVISEQWAREDLGSKMDPPDGTPVMGTSGAPQKNPAKPGWIKWLDQAVNKGKLEAIGQEQPSRICPNWLMRGLGITSPWRTVRSHRRPRRRCRRR
jgi:hypothetical protein